MRSSRQPPIGRVKKELIKRCHKLLASVNAALSKCSSCYPRPNLTTDETLELQRLREDPSLTIAPADKGGQWVLLSSHNYTAEAEKQLHNTDRYRQTSEKMDLHTKQRLTILLQRLRSTGFISGREMKALLPPQPYQQRRFFALPKIHKENWPGADTPPLRAIVSDVGSVSRACATFIEHFLSPIAQSSPSYLRDSQHLIALVSNHHLQPTSVFFSMDVIDLYNSIPINEAIEVVSKAFLQFPDRARPDATIITMLRLLLTHNCFSFNGRQFLQLKGTPMGAAFSGSVANLYMSDWETKSSSLLPRPRFWYRFIDDIFGIWDFSTASLELFHSSLNAIDLNIKVTLSFDFNSIRFLDLELYRDINHLICYRIGFKPTDTHMILPPDSHHPKHIFRGVLLGQVMRWASKSATYEDFYNTKAQVFPVWRRQGHTRSALRQAVKGALQRTQQLPTAWTPGFYPCAADCNVCRYGLLAQRFGDSETSNVYSIFHHLCCNDANTIYVITCSSCSKRYVGQTGRPLRRRISEHLQDISSNRDTPVALHFRSCGLANFSFFAIEKVNHNKKRLQREAAWIDRLHTLEPRGINGVEQSSAAPPTLFLPHSLCGDRVANLARTLFSDVCCTKRRSPNLLKALRTT